MTDYTKQNKELLAKLSGRLKSDLENAQDMDSLLNIKPEPPAPQPITLRIDSVSTESPNKAQLEPVDPDRILALIKKYDDLMSKLLDKDPYLAFAASLVVEVLESLLKSKPI